MEGSKIKKFIELSGRKTAKSLRTGDAAERQLGAQLLLSEVLEYVIKGLGVIPEFSGVKITEPDQLKYKAQVDPKPIEMADGLADVAYTMYWNALTFGVPLEEAFDMVCDNNLDKFVKLENWDSHGGELSREEWHCNQDIKWPTEVVKVAVLKIGDDFFAVGKDCNGKVRKPSSYQPVDLEVLVKKAVKSIVFAR